MVFSTPFSKQYYDVVQIIKRYLPLLNGDETFKNILPVKFVAKHAQTLGNAVSPSLFTSGSKHGDNWIHTSASFKCGYSWCKACKFASVTKTFNSTPNPQASPFIIRNYINCNSKNIISLFTCEECQLQYFGCTSNALKIRIRWHLLDATKELALNVSAASRHFSLVHGGDTSRFTFSGIESVTQTIRGGDMIRKLLPREAFWIFTLGTRAPMGMNIRQDLFYQL